MINNFWSWQIWHSDFDHKLLVDSLLVRFLANHMIKIWIPIFIRPSQEVLFGKEDIISHQHRRPRPSCITASLILVYKSLKRGVKNVKVIFPILCGHLAEVVKSLFLGHSIYERQNPVLILSYLLTFQSNHKYSTELPDNIFYLWIICQNHDRWQIQSPMWLKKLQIFTENDIILP